MKKTERCDICGKFYKNKKLLSLHVVRKHNDNITAEKKGQSESFGSNQNQELEEVVKSTRGRKKKQIEVVEETAIVDETLIPVVKSTRGRKKKQIEVIVDDTLIPVVKSTRGRKKKQIEVVEETTIVDEALIPVVKSTRGRKKKPEFNETIIVDENPIDNIPIQLPPTPIVINEISIQLPVVSPKRWMGQGLLAPLPTLMKHNKGIKNHYIHLPRITDIVKVKNKI